MDKSIFRAGGPMILESGTQDVSLTWKGHCRYGRATDYRCWRTNKGDEKTQPGSDAVTAEADQWRRE